MLLKKETRDVWEKLTIRGGGGKAARLPAGEVSGKSPSRLSDNNTEMLQNLQAIKEVCNDIGQEIDGALLDLGKLKMLERKA